LYFFSIRLNSKLFVGNFAFVSFDEKDGIKEYNADAGEGRLYLLWRS
jgi:hypothetical protein